MPVAKFNSQQKLHAYSVLARINHSFHDLVIHLYDLENAKMFDVPSLHTFRGLAKELQSQLNYKLLSTLLKVEEKHRFEFGKVRIAREHYLNPERPAFGQSKQLKA